MNEHDLQVIADNAAKKAVEGMLTTLGLDVSEPIVAQKQFAALRRIADMFDDEDYKMDMSFLRSLRSNVGKVTDTGLRTVARTIIVFVLGIILLGTKDWWLKHIGG
jgi:hypothetical protein